MKPILKNILRTTACAFVANVTLIIYPLFASIIMDGIAVLPYALAVFMDAAQCCVSVCVCTCTSAYVELFVKNKSRSRNIKFFAFVATTMLVPFFEVLFMLDETSSQFGFLDGLDFVSGLGIILTVAICITVLVVYKKLLWKYDW